MAGEQHRCEQMVWFDGWHQHRCKYKGKFFVNGRWYCGVHNPNKKTKAQKKAEILNEYKAAKEAFRRKALRLVRILAEEGDERAKKLVENLEKARMDYEKQMSLIG